ncbi:hypothetical protein M0208_01845 [Sphingomonas sp. SUN019]|uniref:hypothetical protein n=1 Tax=Sphingomonas sp. SUN019 TaxID=2937788 RepID=UPI0021643F2D|nr:hypothetical protein [Sphingomonas sp. SUN019]UVO49319.1 hypothetical protein M0208_01845 [Sphingomonas sp. SUN019]
MTLSRTVSLMLVVATIPVGTSAQVPNRQVYLPPTPGFVPGYSARQGRQTLVELVPKGQTVKNFTRMITLQTAPVPRGMTEQNYIAAFAKGYVTRCPRARAIVVPLLNRAAGVRIDCPRHPATGQSETVFARAIAMPPEMAIVHYTSKAFVLPKEAGWARDYLGRVAVR